MSDQEQNQQDEQAPAAPSELDMLRQRAKMMNISFSGNTGVETLKAKIAAKMGTADQATEETLDDQTAEGPQQADAATVTNDGSVTVESLQEQIVQLQAQLAQQSEAAPKLNPLAGDTAGKAPAKSLSMRERIRREALKLVRVRITNLDPKKKDLPGEIFTVGNRYIGTIKKYIPYGEATDQGYHIPHVLYENLAERKFLHIRTFKDPVTKRDRQETSWQREFAFEVLPQLTPDELAKLAAAQMAANNT